MHKSTDKLRNLSILHEKQREVKRSFNEIEHNKHITSRIVNPLDDRFNVNKYSSKYLTT